MQWIEVFFCIKLGYKNLIKILVCTYLGHTFPCLHFQNALSVITEGSAIIANSTHIIMESFKNCSITSLSVKRTQHCSTANESLLRICDKHSEMEVAGVSIFKRLSFQEI